MIVRQHPYNGYSLIELLMVLLLLSLCFSFGVPLTQQWYRHHVGLSIQEDIKQALHQGNIQALIRGEGVRLMPLKDNDWSTGLKLVNETDANKPPEIISVWAWHKHHHVLWHGFLSQEYLRFLPELSQSALNGYFLIENSAQEQVKLIINRLGRVRVDSEFKF